MQVSEAPEPAPTGSTYQKISKIRTYVSYLAALLLIIESIMILISIGSAPSLRAFIVTGYFIAFGIIILLVECEKGNINQWFLFLNFGWGKVYLYIFVIVTMLSFPELTWVQWVIASLFLISSVFNIYIGRKFKEQEFERIKGIIERIQARNMNQQS